MSHLEELLEKSLAGQFLSVDEGLHLYEGASLSALARVATARRYALVPRREVTWQIDRNINISNRCVGGCLFCNFHASHRVPAFETSREEYRAKIEELERLGGDQVLLQGGLDPHWGIREYEELFRWLKGEFPRVKLHALGPPEIVHIAKREGVGVGEVLDALRVAGLDSLPGAGAEILSDRVRRVISPGKASTEEWLDAMRAAHQRGMLTSATMMYGHLETPRERIEHLVKLRDLQAEPHPGPGFMAFIAWPFQSKGTRLAALHPCPPVSAEEHLRLVALARIMLPNIRHIQASWLTVGVETGLAALGYGADDMGSIMIEERVVRAAGASHSLDAQEMVQAIRRAGFTPVLRDQGYQRRESDIEGLTHLAGL